MRVTVARAVPMILTMFLLGFMASDAGATRVVTYWFDFVGEDEAHEIVRALYQDELEMARHADPTNDVLIGIGVYTRGDGSILRDPGTIIAYFDHPYFCEEDECRLVILERIASENSWREVFDGFSQGGPVLGTGSAALPWCILTDGRWQMLSWSGERLKVQWDEGC